MISTINEILDLFRFLVLDLAQVMKSSIWSGSWTWSRTWTKDLVEDLVQDLPARKFCSVKKLAGFLLRVSFSSEISVTKVLFFGEF